MPSLLQALDPALAVLSQLETSRRAGPQIISPQHDRAQHGRQTCTPQIDYPRARVGFSAWAATSGRRDWTRLFVRRFPQVLSVESDHISASVKIDCPDSAGWNGRKSRRCASVCAKCAPDSLSPRHESNWLGQIGLPAGSKARQIEFVSSHCPPSLKYGLAALINFRTQFRNSAKPEEKPVPPGCSEAQAGRLLKPEFLIEHIRLSRLWFHRPENR